MITLSQYITEMWNPGFEFPKHHLEMLNKLFKQFDKSKPYKILDLGTGRTSLGYLTEMFPKSDITAITMPGDNRKMDSIKRSVRSKNYKLIETDILNYKQPYKFDIVLCHFLFTEVMYWSTTGKHTHEVHRDRLKPILNAVLKIKTNHLLIDDGYDDLEVNWDDIKKVIKSKKRITKEFLYTGGKKVSPDFKPQPGRYSTLIGMVIQ